MRSKINRFKNLFSVQGTLSQYQEIAEIIDEIVYWLYTGQTLEKALAQIAHQSRLPAFQKALEHSLLFYQMGNDIKTALQTLKSSYPNQFLPEVIETILTSLKMGTSLTGVLIPLSRRYRFFYQCYFEETTAKIPVKLIFPLVFFIFPVIFLLLGSGTLQDFFNVIR